MTNNDTITALAKAIYTAHVQLAIERGDDSPYYRPVNLAITGRPPATMFEIVPFDELSEDIRWEFEARATGMAKADEMLKQRDEEYLRARGWTPHQDSVGLVWANSSIEDGDSFSLDNAIKIQRRRDAESRQGEEKE